MEKTEASIYDLLVIGGGPAGYAAAIYGARGGLTVLVLEQLSAGGQMARDGGLTPNSIIMGKPPKRTRRIIHWTALLLRLSVALAVCWAV